MDNKKCNQTKYDFEYEANGQKVILKGKTIPEINAFINQLKAEKESSMRMTRVKEIEDNER